MTNSIFPHLRERAVNVKAWLAIGCFLSFSHSAVWSADIDIDTQDVGSESIKEPAKRTPFSFNTHGDFVAKTKIDRGSFKGDHIEFAEADAEVGAVVYYCPAYTEGIRLALGYSATYLRWVNSPWVRQDHFYLASLTLGGFTERLHRWFWRTQLTLNFDAKEWSSSYMSYDLLFWGRYAYTENVGLHIGFLAQTGLRLDRAWPILGADWRLSPRWKINLVYPVNVSLEYTFAPSWSLAVAGRMFNSRFRISHHESYCKALIRYENLGAEVVLKYEARGVGANIHAGTTLGGRYRLADRHNHHAHSYHLEPSPYIGAEFDVKF